jgi:hypothetical protein
MPESLLRLRSLHAHAFIIHLMRLQTLCNNYNEEHSLTLIIQMRLNLFTRLNNKIFYVI